MLVCTISVEFQKHWNVWTNETIYAYICRIFWVPWFIPFQKPCNMWANETLRWPLHTQCTVELTSDNRIQLYMFTHRAYTLRSLRSACLLHWGRWTVHIIRKTVMHSPTYQDTLGAPYTVSETIVYWSTSQVHSSCLGASMYGTSLPSLQRSLVCPISKRL